MTRYILHGGFPHRDRQENNTFFAEALSTAPKEAKVLLVYFAKEEDRVEKNKEEDVEQFNKNSGGKMLSFQVASKVDFVEQVKNSDVIYLHGGHTGKLLEALKEFPDFQEAIKGKIVAGDSAGPNVLCAAFYSMKVGVGEGLGIIPIKIICHYREENKDKLNDIRTDLETLFLPEFQFKVLEM
ncbi:MAG: Type 1 glutamine amidotransferase-like domain-containing protein [Patescibacteria group bacterium]